MDNTQHISVIKENGLEVTDILAQVYEALSEKGYNPVSQIVGYIMSGDPTYITSYKGARSLIMKAERDEIIEVLLDFGTKTVGVAISDPLMVTAQPVETITRKSANKLRQTLARIEELIVENCVELIVLGYPKNMNNTVGERAQACETFKEDLERRTALPVILWDERMTTVESERILMAGGVRRENRKAVIDQMAAVLILQSYMDAQNRETEKGSDMTE